MSGREGMVLVGNIWWPADRAPTPEQRTFGANMREKREAKGLSQREMAGMLGVARQQIEKWETGQPIPECLQQAVRDILP